MQPDTQPSQITPAPPIAFGPIPSRRLGRSLGINNIPPKVCSYGCLYCQVGPTLDRATERRDFYPPLRIAEHVAARVEQVRAHGEAVDYLTFVPDGEPTLDAGLAESIRLLRPLGIPVAVITNGSLLWQPGVREALAMADWVSVKNDAAIETVWRRLNRPHPDLDFTTMQDGITRFAGEYRGELVAETMLVAGLNDGVESISAVGAFLHDLAFRKAYLSIPTRPTPYAAITPPDEETVNRAYQVLAGYVPRVECLIGYEGDAFASTGDACADLLAVTAVHPMRVSAVRELLDRGGGDWQMVEDLIESGQLTEVTYRDEQYYLRRWR